MNYIPIRFINEIIIAGYESPPTLEKKPGCPDKFTWQEEEFKIIDILSEWHDYKRRGRWARNMRPGHALSAEKRGSWGVGQDYFRIKTDCGRILEIYFDRAPKDSDQRKGQWYLYRELELEG